MVSGVGTPPRYVGRGGVLDNLTFSTLSPFPIFKVGVGAAAKSGCWVGPLSLSPSSLPASCALAGEWQRRAGLQSPWKGAEPWVAQQDLPTSHFGGSTAR